MIRLIFAFLISFVPTLLVGQIEVSVWTDQAVYHYGDTVAITVSAYNPTADTIVLNFLSSLQASYIVDNFDFSQHVGSIPVLTNRVIPPHQSYSWNNLGYPYGNLGWPLLSIGTHTLIGEVVGYGRSDTLLIIVGPATSIRDNVQWTASSSLGQNYPNPFNGTTWIPFTVSTPARVTLVLCNTLGQRIRTIFEGYSSSGTHLVKVDINELASGVYWCRLETGTKAQTVKLVLSK
jgi:hypothetical protein